MLLDDWKMVWKGRIWMIQLEAAAHSPVKCKLWGTIHDPLPSEGLLVIRSRVPAGEDGCCDLRSIV